MNRSPSLLVLGVTGQVGTLVAQHLKRSKANFSVGSRRKENLKELADQFGASRFIDLDDPRTFDEALKAFRARRNSPVQYSNRRMQREGSNSSTTSRTEEWRTLEA